MKNRFAAFFLFSSFVFLLGACFHAYEILRSGFTPRHALFAGINLLFVGLCLKRPKIFPALVAILAAQQLYSHGTDLVRAAPDVDWNSFGVCVFFPILLFASLKNRT